jgi:hypothetical protein
MLWFEEMVKNDTEKIGLTFFLDAGLGLGSALAFSFFSDAGFLTGAFFLGFSSSTSSSSSEPGGTSASSLEKSSPDSSSTS